MGARTCDDIGVGTPKLGTTLRGVGNGDGEGGGVYFVLHFLDLFFIANQEDHSVQH